jgi:hypothetical protein
MHERRVQDVRVGGGTYQCLHYAAVARENATSIRGGEEDAAYEQCRYAAQYIGNLEGANQGGTIAIHCSEQQKGPNQVCTIGSIATRCVADQIRSRCIVRSTAELLRGASKSDSLQEHAAQTEAPKVSAAALYSGGKKVEFSLSNKRKGQAPTDSNKRVKRE